MIITRFAPSPTGFLHIGGLRTALFNFLFARQNHGKFLLRIEDTDASRNSKEASDAILQAFAWAGLDPDGDVWFQSQRSEIYKKFVQKLLDEKKAYFCYMTREELDVLRANQMAKKQTPRYDGRYREYTGAPRPGVDPVVRIKAPQTGQIFFHDGIKGDMIFGADQIDDFVIARSDGTCTYNFTVAIDDMLSGVTHVLRGDDHLSNTPKQIVIYRALGSNPPKFFHLPMILGEDGAKLSKRHGALNVMEYDHMGILPDALLNFLLRLGFSHGDEEIFSRKDMLAKFDINSLNSAPSRFSASKLLWLNEFYIKNLSDHELLMRVRAFADPKTYEILQKIEQKNLMLLFSLAKSRANTLQKLAEVLDFTLLFPKIYDQKLLQKFHADPKNAKILQNFYEVFGNFQDLDAIKDFLNDFAHQNSLKNKDFLPLLRLALSGQSGGLPVAEHIFLLGSAEARERVLGLKNHLLSV